MKKFVKLHVNKSWCFFFIWDFFHKYSWFTGQQQIGDAISLTPLHHFHPYHRHLDISREITLQSSPLQIVSSRTWNRNLHFPSVSQWPLTRHWCLTKLTVSKTASIPFTANHEKFFFSLCIRLEFLYSLNCTRRDSSTFGNRYRKVRQTDSLVNFWIYLKSSPLSHS